MTGTHRQSVLITGAAKRIGAAIAEGLARDGWAIAVHFQTSEDDAHALVARIRSAGADACAVRADLSDPTELPRLLSAAADAIGPLSCLINNASLFQPDDAGSVTAESWDAHLDTNLRAPALLAGAFAAQLPDGTAGNIINMIDQRVWRLTPRFMSYTISKAGLWALTQTLAQDLAPAIRVNGIGPGPTLRNDRQSADDFAEQAEATLLRRGAGPEEIVAAVRFILASPALTGQMIALDGGQHLAWETPDAIGPE